MEKRPANKFVLMREDAIERILKASLELFSEKGYSGTTVKMIAERAGIVPSAIYHYYEGKHGVLLAVVDYICEEVLGAFDSKLADFNAVRKPEEIVDIIVDVFAEYLKPVRLVVMLVLQKDVPQECKDKVFEIEHRFTRMASAQYEDPKQIQHVRTIAFNFFASVFLLSINYDENRMQWIIETTKEEMRRVGPAVKMEQQG